MAEEFTFAEKSVEDILNKKFIEARLHTDRNGPFREQILTLQRELSGTSALPSYVVVDPESGQALVKFTYIDFKGDNATFLDLIKVRSGG